MSRILSIFLIILGGYYLMKRRFRILNIVLSNPMMRRIAVSGVMNLPFVKARIMNAIFSERPSPNPS